LLASTDAYAAGTIGALVTGTRKTGVYYVFDIKDGDSECDKAQVNNYYRLFIANH